MIPLVVVFIPLTIYAYTQGGINTVSVNTYTLTNGQKTVVFQSMYHIGLRSFYKEVGEEMTSYRNKGYKVLLESMGPINEKPLKKNDVGYAEAVSTYNKNYKENWEKALNKIDGMSIYHNTKYAYQMTAFNRYIVYDDEYADITYSSRDDILNNTAKESNISKEVTDRYKNTDYTYSDSVLFLYKHEKAFIYLENIRDFPLFTFTDKYIESFLGLLMPSVKLQTEITINARNKNLVKHIMNESENLIYVTYGQAHFKGVFNGLKELDSKWRIVSTSQKIVFNSN